MKRKINILIIFVFVFSFILVSCGKSKVVIDDSIDLDESIAQLEAEISKEYGLVDFDLHKIMTMGKEGFKILEPKQALVIYGTYISGDECVLWSKTYSISTDDKIALESASDETKYLLYNDVEYLKGSCNEVSPIKKDVPGWVIKSVHDLAFDK